MNSDDVKTFQYIFRNFSSTDNTTFNQCLPLIVSRSSTVRTRVCTGGIPVCPVMSERAYHALHPTTLTSTLSFRKCGPWTDYCSSRWKLCVIDIITAVDAKKKCRKYSQEYLKYGFIISLTNETMPLCLLCENTFSNDAMKPAKMKDHIEKIHSHKKKQRSLFQDWKKNSKVNQISRLFKAPASLDTEGGLKVSYNISLMIAKKKKAHTTGPVSYTYCQSKLYS